MSGSLSVVRLPAPISPAGAVVAAVIAGAWRSTRASAPDRTRSSGAHLSDSCTSFVEKSAAARIRKRSQSDLRVSKHCASYRTPQNAFLRCDCESTGPVSCQTQSEGVWAKQLASVLMHSRLAEQGAESQAWARRPRCRVASATISAAGLQGKGEGKRVRSRLSRRGAGQQAAPSACSWLTRDRCCFILPPTRRFAAKASSSSSSSSNMPAASSASAPVPLGTVAGRPKDTGTNSSSSSSASLAACFSRRVAAASRRSFSSWRRLSLSSRLSRASSLLWRFFCGDAKRAHVDRNA